MLLVLRDCDIFSFFSTSENWAIICEILHFSAKFSLKIRKFAVPESLNNLSIDLAPRVYCVFAVYAEM